jgi:hypothetical protein
MQPLAEQVAQNAADPATGSPRPSVGDFAGQVLYGTPKRSAPAQGGSRAVGDTDLTNLVTTGDVTVGGDLTVDGACVGCGSAIASLDDIPDLTASGSITTTGLVLGTFEGSGNNVALTPHSFGVAFNAEDAPGFVVGVDPELGMPYIGYDALQGNGTSIRFDDDNRKLTLTGMGGLALYGGDENGVSITGVFRSMKSVKEVAASSVSLAADDNSALIFRSLYGGSALAVSLPSYVNGLNYCFLVRTGQSMTIDPYGAANIIDTLTNSNGDKISNSTAGSSICLVAYAGQWLPYAMTGTWTDAN